MQKVFVCQFCANILCQNVIMDSVIYCLLILKYLLPLVLSNEECAHQNSYDVLKDVPKQCRSGSSITISYTDINIDADTFKDCKDKCIEQLCITKTNLSSVISNVLFKHIPGLKYLDLSDNQISKSSFLDLKSLKRFNISRNNVNIHNITFRNMYDLQVLDLTKNAIDNLSEDIFCYNTKLEELYLPANNIDILPEMLFSNSRKLWKLILNKNRIIEIGQRLFSNMSSISILDLSFNLITVLEAGTFDNNTNLTELYLNDNRITMLPDGLFNKLENLTILHLQRNQLTYIGLNVFPESRKLTHIYLHINQLKYFNASVLKLDGLQKIRLHENNWVCDCHLKALFELSKGILNISPKCEMPEKLSGEHWEYLTAENFTCSSETNYVCMHVREKTIYSYTNNVSNEFCQGDNETVIGHFVTTKGHRYTLQFDISKDDSPSHLTLEHNTNTSGSQCMNSLWIAIVAVTLAILLTEIFILILITLKDKTMQYSDVIAPSTEENVHIYAKPEKVVHYPSGRAQRRINENVHIYAEPDTCIKLPNGKEQKMMEENGHIYAEPDYAAASRHKHSSS